MISQAPAVAEAAAYDESSPAAPRSRTTLRSIALVVACTAFGAVAQVLIRFGADRLDPALFAHGLFANTWLLAGLGCLGLNTLLLVVALREGQLSVLYPIIALTYVWVVILSPMFFDDTINVFKAIGVGTIVAGVSLIGWGSRS